jgi:hypothetical protein
MKRRSITVAELKAVAGDPVALLDAVAGPQKMFERSRDGMTVKQLREHLAKVPSKYDDLKIKVWLPGSTIRLSPMLVEPYHGNILIEGNVDPGSALTRED